MLTNLLKKYKLAATLAFCTLAMSHPYLSGNAYVGVFGGGGASDEVTVKQRGFAFNTPDATAALAVIATGDSGNFASAIVGAHAGYDFETCMWLRPALEFEGFYLRACSGRETDFLFNPHLAEHAFVDKLPLRAMLFFGDFILAFQLPDPVAWLEPYIAGGAGGGVVWISRAHSEQDSPEEPGINHFNSNPSASDGAFAAQFKGGFRFNVHRHWRLFAEYRYLFIKATTYTFGFTQYPTAEHAPTSNWIVHLQGLNYNIGTIGLEFVF